MTIDIHSKPHRHAGHRVVRRGHGIWRPGAAASKPIAATSERIELDVQHCTVSMAPINQCDAQLQPSTGTRRQAAHRDIVGTRRLPSPSNFAGMVTADAKYRRFSMLTDFMYLNLSTSQTNIRSLNFFGLPSRPISRSLELGTSSTLHSAIWTLAGGYTLVEGNCGNFSVIAGLRYADVDFKTDYNLALTVTGPRGNGATFGGPGSISGGGHLWNGIAGFRGHIRLGETGLFIPYYFDIGAGGSNLTWQIASGIGYQTGWASVSALYRHLSFEQDNSATIRHLSLGGPLVMATFRF